MCVYSSSSFKKKISLSRVKFFRAISKTIRRGGKERDVCEDSLSVATLSFGKIFSRVSINKALVKMLDCLLCSEDEEVAGEEAKLFELQSLRAYCRRSEIPRAPSFVIEICSLFEHFFHVPNPY